MAEKLELFYEDEHGQVVVDWDSLAAVTSEDFVWRVKSQINEGFEVVDISEDLDEVEVILIFGGLLVSLIYNHSFDDIRFVCFTNNKLNKYLSLFKENVKHG